MLELGGLGPGGVIREQVGWLACTSGDDQTTPQQGPPPLSRVGIPQLQQLHGLQHQRELPGKKQRCEKCCSSVCRGLSHQKNIPKACTSLWRPAGQVSGRGGVRCSGDTESHGCPGGQSIAPGRGCTCW